MRSLLSTYLVFICWVSLGLFAQEVIIRMQADRIAEISFQSEKSGSNPTPQNCVMVLDRAEKKR